VTDLSWRDDANVLASCSDDGTVRLWEMENGKQVKTWAAHGGVQSVRFGHDGRLVTCGRDAVTRGWDGSGAAQRASEGMTDLATHAAFAHDGRRVIAGDWQGRLRAWWAADGVRLSEVTTKPVPSSERLATAAKELPRKEAELAKATAAVSAAQAAT